MTEIEELKRKLQTAQKRVKELEAENKHLSDALNVVTPDFATWGVTALEYKQRITQLEAELAKLRGNSND